MSPGENSDSLVPYGAYSGPTLYPWDQGPAVAELQELLSAHGYRLVIDGNFGHKTEEAVKRFQQQYGLRIDGVVGAKTWAALKHNLVVGARTLKRGHTGADVRELQGLLQIYGLPVHRTGIFDDETEQAVIAFQQRQKLKADGQVDNITWTTLRQGNPLPDSPKQNRWFIDYRRWW